MLSFYQRAVLCVRIVKKKPPKPEEQEPDEEPDADEDNEELEHVSAHSLLAWLDRMWGLLYKMWFYF